MRPRGALGLLLIGGAASTAGMACAAELAPGPTLLLRAQREGAAIAARKEGYPLRDYVIHEVRDARGIDPLDGAVDAVVVATPFERARHAAYLEAREGKKPKAASADIVPFTIGIVVFAHSAREDDRDFASRFGSARLVVVGGPTIEAAPVASETTEAIYPLAQADRERLVATITYSFPLATIARAGQRQVCVDFVDSTGKAFALPINLARFR